MKKLIFALFVFVLVGCEKHFLGPHDLPSFGSPCPVSVLNTSSADGVEGGIIFAWAYSGTAQIIMHRDEFDHDCPIKLCFGGQEYVGTATYEDVPEEIHWSIWFDLSGMSESDIWTVLESSSTTLKLTLN